MFQLQYLVGGIVKEERTDWKFNSRALALWNAGQLKKSTHKLGSFKILPL